MEVFPILLLTIQYNCDRVGVTALGIPCTADPSLEDFSQNTKPVQDSTTPRTMTINLGSPNAKFQSFLPAAHHKALLGD